MLRPELRPPDLENLHGTDTGRDYLSHTSIGVQLACLRKYGYAYDEHLEPVRRARALDMGSAFAHGLERGDGFAAEGHLAEQAPPFLEPSERDQLAIEGTTVRCAVDAYLRRWGRPPSEQREYEYRVRLRSPYTGAPSRTFDLVGRADGVIDSSAYLELIEDKLVGRIDPTTVRRLPLDRQVGLGCYALWRVTGKEVRKIHYRFVRKPQIRQRQNESLSDFLARLEQDYIERPDFYTHEESLFRSADDLLLLEEELWDWAEQRRNARARHLYARNTSHCGDFGGCQFLPLCLGDADARSLYRTREENRACPAPSPSN